MTRPDADSPQFRSGYADWKRWQKRLALLRKTDRAVDTFADRDTTQS